MQESHSAKILFEVLAKCFEKQEVKAVHYIVDGARAVVAYREDGREYQITIKPIQKPHANIDPEEFFKNRGTVVPLAAAAKDRGD